MPLLFIEPTPNNILVWVIITLGGLVATMGGALAIVLKGRKPETTEPATGDTRPSEWHERFDELEKLIDGAKKEATEGNRLMHDFMLMRDRDFRDVNRELVEIKTLAHAGKTSSSTAASACVEILEQLDSLEEKIQRLK